MGWFSGKTVTTVGVSALDLGSNGYSKYYDFRKNLLFAVKDSNTPIEKFQNEMFKYRQSVRHSYSSAKLQQYGISPINSSTTVTQNSTISTIFKNNPDYYNLRYPDYIAPRNTDFQSTSAEEDFLVSEALQVRMGMDGYGSYEYRYIDSLGEYGYTEKPLSGEYTEPPPAQDGVSVNATSTPSNHYLIYDSHNYDELTRISTVSYRLYYRPKDSNDVNLISTVTDEQADLTEYVCSGFVVYTSGFNQNELIVRTPDALNNTFISNTTNQQYEPFISLKEANKASIEDPSSIPEEERLRAFYQNKILESIGMNFKSAEPYISNDKITDLKVGMVFNLETLDANHGVMHSFFNNLENLSGGLDISYVGANHIYSDTIYPVNNINTITLPLSDMTLEISFQLERISRDHISSAIPNKLKCKVKLYSDDPLIVRNTPDLIDTYETYYGDGSSNGLTAFEMRDNIATEYNNTANPSDALKEAYGLLPTVRQLSDLQDVIDTIVYMPYYTNVSDIEAFLVNLDSDTYTGFHVQSYSYISTGNSRFKYEITKNSVVTISKYPEFNNRNNSAKYVIRRTDDETNSEIIYVLCGLKMRYYDSSGHDYTTFGAINSTTPFFIPVTYGSLDNIPFYDYIEAYDVMMTGIAFSVQTVKLKWYQTEIFSVILQIVLVVIAVAIEVLSAGSGTPISASILAVAEDMAIAFAITTVVTEVAKALDIESSVVQVAVSVVTAYFTKDTTQLFESLGLIAADQALKYQTEQYRQDTSRLIAQQKELDKKLKLISLYAEQSNSDFKPWAILDNIINSQNSENPSDSNVNLSIDLIEEGKEANKYSVKPINKGIYYDVQDTAFNSLNHAERQYSIEYQIGNITDIFGDNSNI